MYDLGVRRYCVVYSIGNWRLHAAQARASERAERRRKVNESRDYNIERYVILGNAFHYRHSRKHILIYRLYAVK